MNVCVKEENLSPPMKALINSGCKDGHNSTVRQCSPLAQF